MGLKEYLKVDLDGNVLDVIALDPEEDEIPENHFTGWGDRSFYQPIWDFDLGDWVEGLSQEEIDAINNRPHNPSPEERIEQLEAVILQMMMEG